MYDSYETIVDDGMLFFTTPSYAPLYIAPLDDDVQASLEEFENGIYFSPFVLRGKSGATYTRMIMFNMIDRGFVGYSDGSMWPNRYTKLDATLEGQLLFHLTLQRWMQIYCIWIMVEVLIIRWL